MKKIKKGGTSQTILNEIVERKLLEMTKAEAVSNFIDDEKYIELVLSEGRKCQKSYTLNGMFMSKRLWMTIQLN